LAEHPQSGWTGAASEPRIRRPYGTAWVILSEESTQSPICLWKNRHKLSMKLFFCHRMGLLAKFIWLLSIICFHGGAAAQTNSANSLLITEKLPDLPSLPSLPELAPPKSPSERKANSQGSDAHDLLKNTAERIAYGPPVEATIRQRVWVEDKTIVGVGHYQQLGQGQGKYRLEMVLPLGETKSELVQINDGHLAWSSQRTGDTIRIWRVDVLRLDDLAADRDRERLPPRMRVIGIIELLDALSRDYQLELAKGVLNEQPVWIARGQLRVHAVQRLSAARGLSKLPKYVPDFVQIAIAAGDATIPLMPVRIEYWHGNPQDSHDPEHLPRAIGLWEVTKYQVWAQPDERRFQLPAERLNVDAENRTHEYADRFINNRSVAMLPTRQPFREPVK
jgi:hypothetical protein